MVPEPGRAMPSASTRQPIVLAVPITMQVPWVGARRPLSTSISASSIWPARCWPQRRRQSVQAPSTSPLWWPTSIGPVISWIAGTSALTAPMSWAGTVLSQPPISTTESQGWARIISSVSIAIRLRRNIEVGLAKDSWMEIVGNSIGRPPASITPRFTASISRGTLPWQGLKSLKVLVMPMIGRSSASSEKAGGLDEGLAQEQREARNRHRSRDCGAGRVPQEPWMGYRRRKRS